MTFPSLTPEQKAEIYNLSKHTDLFQWQIAERVGCSQHAVQKWSVRMGVKWPNRGKQSSLQEEDRIRAAVLVRYSRLTARQIGELLGKSESSVYRCVRRIDPDVDFKARDAWLRRLARGDGTYPDPELPRGNRWHPDAMSDEERQCPRQQRIDQCKRAFGPPKKSQFGAAREWSEVAEEFNRRKPDSEPEISSDAAKWTGEEALEKLRTLLEEYEFPEDTPNRNFSHLRETV
jgi:hypothetical protein